MLTDIGADDFLHDTSHIKQLHHDLFDLGSQVHLECNSGINLEKWRSVADFK